MGMFPESFNILYLKFGSCTTSSKTTSSLVSELGGALQLNLEIKVAAVITNAQVTSRHKDKRKTDKDQKGNKSMLSTWYITCIYQEHEVCHVVSKEM